MTQVSIWQAYAGYLEANPGKTQPLAQQELQRFARRFNSDAPISSITPLDIEKYCESLDGVGDERAERLSITKEFLRYIHREGLTELNLAPHAKLRRLGRRGAASQRKGKQSASNQLTPEGYQRLQDELAFLKAQRFVIADEIRKAAATKDFTENSPLDAAREQQGQAESRIRDLEALLKGATILDGSADEQTNISRVGVGSRVILRHTRTGQEVSFLLVDSSEIDPSSGKISDASPIGRALLDRTVGDEVDVVTPRGTVQYLVAKIGL
ncbi:MAG: transcription elongation factor GreA [Chloroflexi bacterium]|nr:transcription elongation factor GreA [Chloroflexota bacterium]